MLIAQSLEIMGEEYHQGLMAIFNTPYVDAAVHAGKAFGSYAGALYGSAPFVFLSYHECLADVYTLTHELGHALHASFSQKHQPFIYANLSTPAGFLAEVASNVHEMLLTQYLLRTTTEKRTRCAVLSRVVDAYQTAFFIPMLYAELEYVMYRAAKAGEVLTAEYLNSTYMNIMKQQYGSELVLDERASVRWSFSAHLYESFYSYQYPTGVAAAASLMACKCFPDQRVQRAI